MKTVSKPDAGKVLVTGSSGAVGGIATKLLLKLGYEVVALTSRPEYNRDYLKSFGNIEVLDTNDFSETQECYQKKDGLQR